MFYGTTIDGSQVSSENKRLVWCERSNSVISVEDWQKACLKAQTQAINSHLKLIQCKWLTRTDLTPTLLNKSDPDTSDVCVKCGAKGTLIHCLWKHPQIQTVWTEVLNVLSFITGVKIKLCITHNYTLLCVSWDFFPVECKLNTENKKMTVYCLLQAKHNMADTCKSISRPSLQAWLASLSNSLVLEKPAFMIRGKYSTFKKIWKIFLLFLEGENATEALLT